MATMEPSGQDEGVTVLTETPLPLADHRGNCTVWTSGTVPIERVCDLTVMGVGDDCLELRAWPGTESEVLGCLAEGMQLFSYWPWEELAPDGGGIAVEIDDVTWRMVYHRDDEGKLPYWANARHLEGPEATVMGPLPAVEFPDDVALMGRAIPRFAYPYEGFQTELLRIYRHEGELVRETLFLPHFPERELHDYEIEAYADYLSPSGIPDPDSWSENLDHIAAPDGSSIIMTLCVPAPCWTSLDYTEDPPSSTAIYESRDGGLTWQHLASFDLPWVAVSILPSKDEDGRTRLILQALFPFFQDDGSTYSQYPDDPFMLWPSGKRGKYPLDLYLSEGEDAEMVESCPDCLRVSDELHLLSYRYTIYELLGGAAPTSLGPDFSSFGEWLTIRNLNTLEQWPIRLPDDVMRSSIHWITPLAIQQGPFLRVVDDVGDCLPVLAEPSLDAEELACMAARVLLTDLGETVELEGTTWHKVKTPAGVEGWADGGRLE